MTEIKPEITSTEILEELRRFRKGDCKNNKIFTADTLDEMIGKADFKFQILHSYVLRNFVNVLSLEKDKQFFENLIRLIEKHDKKIFDNIKGSYLKLYIQLTEKPTILLNLSMLNKEIKEEIDNYFVYFLKTVNEEIVVKEYVNASYITELIKKDLLEILGE